MRTLSTTYTKISVPTLTGGRDQTTREKIALGETSGVEESEGDGGGGSGAGGRSSGGGGQGLSAAAGSAVCRSRVVGCRAQ